MSEDAKLSELPAPLRLQLKLLVGSLTMLERQLALFPVEFIEEKLLTDVLFEGVPVVAAIAKWRANTAALYEGTTSAPGSEEASSRPRTVDHRKEEEPST